MRLLIDTQVLLWFQGSDPLLSDTARDLILDNSNTCYVSMASLWEIAIKTNLNKLNIGMKFSELEDYLLNFDFKILDIKYQHLVQLLSLANYHKDPFDRILIAQAMVEGFPMVSFDRHFESYAIKVLK